MPTLEAIETKIKRLQEQAQAIKAKKASATLDRIVELMRGSGITIADIEAHLGANKRSARSERNSVALTATVAAKYIDPKSGATWSGRGRAPAWIANAKNRDRFLVERDAVNSSAPAESKAKKRGNYVRGPQPAKYRDPETGATWSGRGRAPAWIASVKDRSKFSIAVDTRPSAVVKTTSRRARSKMVSRTRKGPPKGKQAARYLNPETGATWSGRGPAPAWLAAASDRSKFLIGTSAANAPAT
ncbi:H-NS histone family protein [Burkholderia sp. Se-20373]|uniref:H-NS family nucleoid-associated regulatory protein n=1 Tax=Burkholderia sp. Se-20373 TaxID=2703898 RepID=UPI00240265DA|nr:H-NS family nucleoid-associated regulatory protein [Burkholderia sp. Se-20373]MBN3748535.1 H-NS histone family protein [Burkholderia sp. Se-20373]